MVGLELVIIFKQDKAYLTSDTSLTFDQLGFPDFAKCFKSPEFWTIRVLNYINEEKKLCCEVISYNSIVHEFGYNQMQLSNILSDLQFITFSDLNTTYFIKACERPKTFKIPTAKKMPVDKPKTHSVSESIVRKPIMRSIIETFSVPIKKVRFKYHCVSFDYTFKDYYKTIELTISNPDIIEEFDAIKNYFANVLKTKNIQVIANIEIVDDNIVSTEVNSPEISKIDEQIIDAVKHEFIKSTIKKKSNGKIEKSSFTMDEYFDAFADEGIKPNTFYNNDKEFFEDLLKIVNTKHYKHLRYLSSKHSHDIMKLRFVHEPFSFIFLITGVENYYIIWETLDTQEATYVWQITKNIKQLKMTILKIEEIICKIKVQGKMPYLKSREDSLIRVFHDYSDNVGGFVKWKGEIESKLK